MATGRLQAHKDRLCLPRRPCRGTIRPEPGPGTPGTPRTPRTPGAPGPLDEPGPLDVRCDFCGKIVRGITFKSHVRAMHPGEQKSGFTKKCPWCEKKVSYQSLEMHIKRRHFWGRFKCQICEFKASFAKGLAGHMEENHKECCDAACPSCRKKFAVTDLESHYKECINQKWKEKIAKRIRINKVCETCGKHFNYQNPYKYHLKIHLRERLANGEEGLDESNLFFHCEKCGAVFKTKIRDKLYKNRSSRKTDSL